MTHERSDLGGKIGIVLLAAGASSRMGTPKQLLKIKGISLIRHAAVQAVDSGCRPIVVVLGANADLVSSELTGLELNIAVNREWNLGMSSSIRCGLKAILAFDPHVQAVILFLGDQPNVTGTSLRRLTLAHARSGSGLVAASYSRSIGTPAIFSKIYFDDLLQIQGKGGAKGLLKRHASRVLPIDFPEAVFDLDTPRDLVNLAKGKQSGIKMP